MDDLERMKRLRDAEQAYRTDQGRAEASKAARDQEVWDALDADWSHSEISEATGLSRSRVGQIALKRGRQDQR